MRLSGFWRLLVVAGMTALGWLAWERTIDDRLTLSAALQNQYVEPSWTVPVILGIAGIAIAALCIGLAVWVRRGFR
jgi:hypothetical protein